jgi:hypothetical protein
VGAVELAPVKDAEAADAGAPVAGDVDSVCSLWPAVVELVRGENGLLGALIAEARPVELDGEDLTVAFASSKPFLRKKASVPVNRAAVTEALRAVTGSRFRLSFELRDDLGGPQQEDPESAPTEEEWIRRLVEEFDAEELHGEWNAMNDVALEGDEVRAATSEETG